MDAPIQLIVGLGNPGDEYHHTRHNAGADLVTTLADRAAAPLIAEKKFFGLSTQVTLNGRTARLIIPTTFMNRSGQAVAAIAGFYRIPVESILVVHDELDLPPGVARLKIGGGHGGHNGLRDIISALGNNRQFARLRLGIGHPGDARQVTGYVLKKAPAQEFAAIEATIDAAIEIMPLLLDGSWNRAMQALHTAST